MKFSEPTAASVSRTGRRASALIDPPPGVIFLVDLHMEGGLDCRVDVALYDESKNLLDTLTINCDNPFACFPGIHPDVDDWLELGEPECWC